MGSTEMAVKALVFAIMICGAVALFEPVSETHRSAAVELFLPKEDGSYGSLEETYQALRSFQVLGIEAKNSDQTCQLAFEALKYSSAQIKDIYYALKITEILKCPFSDADVVKGIASKLLSHVKGANSLLDYYYPLSCLVSIKNQDLASESGIILEDASGIFQSIKGLP